MPAPSSSWTVIATTAVDSDSPVDQPLMQAIRGNLIHLEEWLGLSYTAAQDHDHDGSNSKSVVLADLSIATAKYQNTSVTEGKLASAAVSQAKMKTTTGTLLHVTGWQLLPGGEYGFVPQLGSNTAATASSAMSSGTTASAGDIGGSGGGTISGVLAGGGTSYTGYVYLTQDGNTCSGAHLQQRYVSASPPYDYGNGEAHMFLYALVDKNGKSHGLWIAIDPVWAYNGPTWIAPDYHFHGKGYQRRLILPANLADLETDGPRFELVEVDQALKNADMDIVPHPFGTIPDGQRVVLLDPCCELMAKLADMHDMVTDQNGNADPHGFDYSPPGFLLSNDYIRLDNKPFTGRTPKGVQTVTPKWKLTR